MSNYIFSKIAKDGLRHGQKLGSIDSRDWYREAAREVTTVSEKKIMAKSAGKRLQTDIKIEVPVLYVSHLVNTSTSAISMIKIIHRHGISEALSIFSLNLFNYNL